MTDTPCTCGRMIVPNLTAHLVKGQWMRPDDYSRIQNETVRRPLAEVLRKEGKVQ
jgi:hypothetical protein